ncbi:MAG: hypothetical protein K0S53_1578 [Bacteroidetes bacterium]|jgi:hypothetical protein|nr:hypothetical protein [Bacteroidota bacterium]
MLKITESIKTKSYFFLLLFSMFNILCFSRTNLFKERISFFQSRAHDDLREASLARTDSSRHYFINKVSISVGLFNYWNLLNFEKHNYSLANSYHLALISNKRKIAFRLGSITEGESYFGNRNGEYGFRSGSFGYIGVAKCFYFKRLNYNIGVAGSSLNMMFYPETSRERIGGGLLMDISFNITKRFFVTAYYINSINHCSRTELDNYLGCSFGMNFYEGRTKIW